MRIVFNPVTGDIGPGRYLLTFYAPVVPASALRAISDYVNVEAELINRFPLEMTHWKINGTTVKPSESLFLVDATVTGTPLFFLANPIVQVIFILTAGAVLLTFVKAVLIDVGDTIKDIGGGISGGVKDIGGGIKDIGAGLGEGFRFGLPLAAFGAAFIGVTYAIRKMR